MSVTDGTILKVVISFVYTDGAIMQNVYNAVVTGGGSPWDDEDIIDDAVAWMLVMYGNLSAGLTSVMVGSQVQVYEYDAIDDDWDEVGADPITFVPTGTADQMPRGNSALVNLRTTDPDVSGKKYIPGLQEGNIVSGQLATGFMATLVDYAIDWFTPFVGATSGATWTTGVWSVVGKVFKAAISSAVVNGIVAYQRRRKRGVGI